MVVQLRALGSLRREKEPSPELILELFRSAADRLRCSECGHTGVVIAPCENECDDDAWGMPRGCTSCGKPIPAERIELFPDIRLCVDCQRREESGAVDEQREFCPKCGAVMTLVSRRTGGISRYEMKCPECRG